MALNSAHVSKKNGLNGGGSKNQIKIKSINFLCKQNQIENSFSFWGRGAVSELKIAVTVQVNLMAALSGGALKW